MGTIRIKRVYDGVEDADGTRFLVERLWPRGFRKDELQMEAWLKDVAPSPELRKWYGHEPDKWEEFRRRYLHELKEDQEQIAILLDAAEQSDVTLLYSAKDTARNSAVVLKDHLEHLQKKHSTHRRK